MPSLRVQHVDGRWLALIEYCHILYVSPPCCLYEAWKNAFDQRTLTIKDTVPHWSPLAIETSREETLALRDVKGGWMLKGSRQVARK